MEFVSIKWLKPLFKQLARIQGKRAEEVRIINDTFGDAKLLAQYYIEPKCQHHNPADHKEDTQPLAQVRAPAFEAVNEFLSGDILPQQDGGTVMFILSDAGMGKTSLLMMLRLSHLMSFWPANYECLLLKLGEDTLDVVKKHNNKTDTVLLLDALDEDPLAWGQIESRLLAILNATEHYRRVIISCRTQFFPETGSDPFSKPGRVSVGGYTCPMIFISLFNDAQVSEYLKKRFSVKWYNPGTYNNREKRRQAEDVISSMHSLRFRPLLLAHVQNILGVNQIEWNAYTLYKALVNAWLMREERKLRSRFNDAPDREILWAACSLVAQYMQQQGVRTLSQTRLKELIQSNKHIAHLKELDVGGRSLLNRNAAGEYRFSHYSIQEFLVADAILRHDLKIGVKIKGTDLLIDFLIKSGGSIEFHVFERLDLGSREDVPNLTLVDRLKDGGLGPEMRMITREQREKMHGIQSDFKAIGVYPVTFDEFNQAIYKMFKYKVDLEDSGFGQGKRPVININWIEALTYCAWLAEKTGYLYRLPTSDEWLNIAGGLYHIKQLDEANNWFVETSGSKTHPVGGKNANWLGVHDMFGNVWEWTSSHAKQATRVKLVEENLPLFKRIETKPRIFTHNSKKIVRFHKKEKNNTVRIYTELDSNEFRYLETKLRKNYNLFRSILALHDPGNEDRVRQYVEICGGSWNDEFQLLKQIQFQGICDVSMGYPTVGFRVVRTNRKYAI